jgi:hypothetical protein
MTVAPITPKVALKNLIIYSSQIFLINNLSSLRFCRLASLEDYNLQIEKLMDIKKQIGACFDGNRFCSN